MKSRFIPRKRPKQQRSEILVQSILQATEKLVEKIPHTSITTTKIARLTGISIGSLYQYFPNKQSIAFSLIEKHVQTSLKSIKELIEKEKPQTFEEMINLLVYFCIDYQVDRHLIFKFMFHFLHHIECLEQVIECRSCVIAILEDYAEKMHLDPDLPDRKQAITMAVITVGSIMDYVTTFDNGGLSKEQIKRETTLLVNSYFLSKKSNHQNSPQI